MRKTLDIRNFDGIISSIDEADIPENSATDSLNIDGDVSDGVLQSIPTDVADQISSSNYGGVTNGKFIEINGIYYLIYHDKANNKISVICDFYNTEGYKKKIDLITSLSSDEVDITVNNKQVHIGIKDSNSYWVGYIGRYYFNYAPSASLDLITNNSGEIQVRTTYTTYFKSGSIVKITGADSGTGANGYWKTKIVNHYDKTYVLDGSTYTTSGSTGTIEEILNIEYSVCYPYIADSQDNFHISSISSTAGAGYFTADTYYEWRLSVVYDGIQESPMMAYPSINSYNIKPSANAQYITLAIRALGVVPTLSNDELLFNKRITAINLWRADSIDSSSANIGLFRKVASFSITDNAWITDGTTPSTKYLYLRDYGNYVEINLSSLYNFSTSRTEQSELATYKENTGMPETLTSSARNWALATSGSGYHFVTSDRIIYRSKQFRFDMFDYTVDFVIIPEKITALAFFEGKLYAFSLNKLYRINPDYLVIEDVYDDAGAMGQRSVHTNEWGMFFANKNYAWLLSGSELRQISNKIKNSKTNGKSWRSFEFTNIPEIIITSDANKGYVLFINDFTYNSQSKILIWAYLVRADRWDAWILGEYLSGSSIGAFKGKDGEVYLSLTSLTYKILRGTSYQNWEWISKDFDLENIKQVKMLNKIKLKKTGTITISIATDGSATFSGVSDDTYINSYIKSVRVKLSASSGTHNVDSMSILYRPLIGVR